nr:serine/arginine repetitive matrix protein 2-like [Procambarus clarkii]XP_045582852.1 serine/arginine repetitive matrix protein 2-like [Procambarus clarkii]XP_045582853.1 serine/arginine repetitive matrix protein 2-like [Procambarus clarkii]XP_045582854.1 serine/arginine repetitive matrix protein 2-like [Procambarus clarkii]XP_045582855.1 serine/arginine repetitive matrix protein 2-like [Procambarus clarkii]
MHRGTRMFGTSRVFDDLRMQDTPGMLGSSRIFGDSRMQEDFTFMEDSRMPGNPRQHGSLRMQGEERMYPEPRMQEDLRIPRDARMFPEPRLGGETRMQLDSVFQGGSSRMPDHAEMYSRMQGEMGRPGDMKMHPDSQTEEDLRMYLDSRMQEQPRDESDENIYDYNHKPLTGLPNISGPSSHSHTRMNSQDDIGHGRSGYLLQSKSTGPDLPFNSASESITLKKNVDFMFNATKGFNPARQHGSSHILTPSLTLTSGSQNTDGGRGLETRGPQQQKKCSKAFDYLREWRVKMNLPTDAFMVERDIPTSNQQHINTPVSSSIHHPQSDIYTHDPSTSNTALKPMGWTFSTSSFAEGDTHRERSGIGFDEPRGDIQSYTKPQSFRGRQSQENKRMDGSTWKWGYEASINQSPGRKRHSDTLEQPMYHERDFSVQPGSPRAKRPHLSPPFTQMGRDHSEHFRDTHTGYGMPPQSKTPVCDEQLVDFKVQDITNYYSPNNASGNWKFSPSFPRKHSPDSGRLTRASFEMTDPSRSLGHRSHSLEMRNSSNRGKSLQMYSQNSHEKSQELTLRDRSFRSLAPGRSPGPPMMGHSQGPITGRPPGPPMRGRSPGPPVRGRSPGPPMRERPPGPPMRGRSPGPPMRGRSPVPPMRGRSPGPPMRGRSPGPPMRGRSPGPPIRGRSPGPPMRGRSPGPPMRGRSPGPPMRGRSPGPPMRGRSPGPPMRGRSPGPPLRGRSPGPIMRGRSPGPPMRGRSPGPPMRERSPGPPTRERSPGLLMRGRSPGLPTRGRSPGLPIRRRSPGAHMRGRSPGPHVRERSPGPSARGRSPGPSARGRSPGPSARGRSPGPSARGRSPGPSARGRSPGPSARGRSPGPSARGRSPGPSARGRSPGPSARGRSPGPSARGRSPGPSARGRSPGPLVRGRFPGPPARVRSPGPPVRGRSPVSQMRGRSPGPHTRRRSPGPPVRGRSPVPHVRGRSPVPHVRGRSPGPPGRGRSPGPPGRGRSPGPPGRGRSSGLPVRGRSSGLSVRGRSSGPPVRGRSPGPPVRGRSPGPQARGRSPVQPARGRSPGLPARSLGPSGRDKSSGPTRERTQRLSTGQSSGLSQRGRSPGVSVRRYPGSNVGGRSPHIESAKHFGQKLTDRSPLLEEVSLSPRSSKFWSPGTKLSQDLRSPQIKQRRNWSLSPESLHRGCSPVSPQSVMNYTGEVNPFSQDKFSSGSPRTLKQSQMSKSQHRSPHLRGCSPVSPEIHSRSKLHHTQIKGRNSPSRGGGRIPETQTKSSEVEQSEECDTLNIKKWDELEISHKSRDSTKSNNNKREWAREKSSNILIPQNGSKKPTQNVQRYVDEDSGNVRPAGESKMNTESTPEEKWKPKSKEEENDEDLRVHLLRLREQKVEQKLKKLEEESIETEFMLWKIQKNKSSLKDKSPGGENKKYIDDDDDDFHHSSGTGGISPHSLKRQRSSSPAGRNDRRPVQRPFRKPNRF